MKTTEERVSALEARVFRCEDDTETLLSRTASHGASIAHIHDAVGVLSGDLRALTHEVRTEVVPRLDRIEADVAELKADVAELKADVAELKADVAELKADVTELKSDMAGVKQGVAALLAHFNITAS